MLAMCKSNGMQKQLTARQAIDLALQRHRTGELAVAENLYRQILAQWPDDPMALQLLGVVYHQRDQNEAAEPLIRRALRISPDLAQAHSNLGNVLVAQGRPREAIACFRRAVRLDARMAMAWNNLANLLSDAGDNTPALQAYRRAIELDPTYAEAWSNLSTVLLEEWQIEQSIAAARRAIQLKPDCASAYLHLGNALAAQCQPQEALAAHRQALHHRPDYPEALMAIARITGEADDWDRTIAAHRAALVDRRPTVKLLNSLALALKERDQVDEAMDLLHQALQLDPQAFLALRSQGELLIHQGQADAGIDAVNRALAIKPNFPEAHCTVGIALFNKNQPREAMAAFRQALALAPEMPDAHSNVGIALLKLGELEEGWREYEWRLRVADYKLNVQKISKPRWNGEPLEGRTILLHSEQGLGDTIHFIRYVPMVAERGGRVILGCPKSLHRLLGHFAPIAETHDLNSFDVHCPIMSLPHVFGKTLETIPNRVPYLFPDANEIARWAERIAALPHQRERPRKVGLAWAGNPANKSDRQRSMPFAMLAPLSRIPGVRLFSLQKGSPAQELAARPSDFEIIDWTEEFSDFNDAALMAQLDLIITVDTSVAHVAAALGRPTWIMLCHSPDWRWMLDREDSPWYPTARLFRQPVPGDWRSVVQRVADEVLQLSAFESAG